MRRFTLTENDVEMKAILSGGPGGQNVNKVATAIQLKFDIPHSRLPEQLKTALLQVKDRRINRRGIVTITARQHRSQEANRQAALQRLNALVQKATEVPGKRKPTRPTRSSIEGRLNAKKQRSQFKRWRSRVDPPDEQ